MRAFIGALLLGACIGLAMLAEHVSPQDPIRQDLGMSLFAPDHFHPLGTDGLGRDVLSRVAHGARVSLLVAVAATTLAALLGAAVGLAAGTLGPSADRALMRLTDLMLAFPTLALLLVMASLFRTDSVAGLVVLLGLTSWMPVARLVRAEAWSLSRQRFVEAACSLGASPARRAVVHLLPHLASTVVIAATLQVGDTMLLESGLSFLGLGVAAPTPSWGDMVRQGMSSLDVAWWVSAFPGLALALTVIGLNLIGDGLRDALDPRLSRTSLWVPRLGTLPPSTS